MPWALVSVDDPRGWADALRHLPHAFTHSWEHCKAVALTTGEPTFLWNAEEGAERLACPVMLRQFEGHTDLASPPGVAGFTGTPGCETLRSAWELFTTEHKLVAGYIVLHPLFAPPFLQAAAASYNSVYLLDLRQDAESLLRGMNQNRRRELRTYDELCARMTTSRERVTEFVLANYSEHAARIGMPTQERWNDATLRAYCGAATTLLVGLDGPTGIVAAHIYGYSAHAAEFSLLIASRESRKDTTGMIWHAIQHLQALGVPWLNLGGGAHDDDPIAAAKQRLGATRLPLAAIRQVYDHDAYDLLCAQRAADPSGNGYFPAYRRGLVIS